MVGADRGERAASATVAFIRNHAAAIAEFAGFVATRPSEQASQ
jgi:hypothetical protein